VAALKKDKKVQSKHVGKQKEKTKQNQKEGKFYLCTSESSLNG
jgi:hypothetical protein